MSAFGHLVNFVITLLFWPWVFVWILIALMCAGSNRKKELELLREIAKQGRK